MKLLELEINNIRGIPHLLLKPEGQNVVIWGPNGSGKSSVVDAIDFLLTGRIARLSGKGTGPIKLKDHGPHIDHQPEEATVRARIQLLDLPQPIEIKRCMGQPNTLECSIASNAALKQIGMMASRGQHVLTRREILRFITAESSTRAKQIQELLSIEEIEDIRTALGKSENELGKAYNATQHTFNTARIQVAATIQAQTYNEMAVLDVVNQNRAILNGQPIAGLRAADLKQGLTPPVVLSASIVPSPALLANDIRNLQEIISAANQSRLAQADRELRAALSALQNNPQILRSLSKLQLLELGLTLLDDTGACPLCDTPWPPHQLYDQLTRKLSQAQVANELDEQIKRNAVIIGQSVDLAMAIVQQLINVAQKTNRQPDRNLQSWLNDLRTLSEAVHEPVARYLMTNFSPEQIQHLLAPANLQVLLNQIQTTVQAQAPQISPAQLAWDMLTRLEENLKNLEQTTRQHQAAQLAYQKAEVLNESFLKARDKVLGQVYATIRDRFVELYRQLHGTDEDTFGAILAPDGAGLNLAVNFYNRGIHPPHALHSEGHQDSMGLCLYLALTEHLNQQILNLVILDDVVMSIDAGHRRKLCQLLANVFPGRQFLITTHDKTWATQLRSEGVVASRSVYEFYRWNVTSGPWVSQETDLWEKMAEDLAKHDVPAAAARLRRGSEHFFEIVCDRLQARVKYKSNGRWELGDFLPAAIGQYKDMLRQARKSANSWNNKEIIEKLVELDSIAGSIFKRSQAEQWGINASVHYNNWTDFQPSDFQPIFEAFQDLHSLFKCSQCGCILYLVSEGLTPANLRCNCGQVNWNLTEK